MTQLEHKIQTMNTLETRDDFITFISSCKTLVDREIDILINCANKIFLLKSIDKGITNIKKITKWEIQR